MSYETGWAAINLQMPKRIPRTEFSAYYHWDLVNAVTGINVGVDSPNELKDRASAAFMRAWNYDWFQTQLIMHDELGEFGTDMGHGEYAPGGGDRRDAKTCRYKDPEDVLSFDPWESLGEKDREGLIRRFEADYQASCQARPFCVNVTGIYITLVSGLISLFGWDMLLYAAGTDPERFGQLASRYCSWVQQYYDALGEADVPVVSMHDDIVWSSGTIFRPAWYRKYVFPNYKKLVAPLLESGKKIIYTCDGDFTQFVDDIALAGVHGFVFEPYTDLNYIVERYGQTHVIIGNADTRILLLGTKEEIHAEVERCMSLGRNCPGFFMAVGNCIPHNTPVENALYYNQVYEELCWR